MDTNDFEGRLKRRKLLSAQLIIGVDDDLIEWIESYQNGERNAAIKTTLRLGRQFDKAVKVRAGKRGRPRQYVDEPVNQPVANLPEEILARLEQMHSELDQLRHENSILQEYKDYNEQRWQVWEQGGPERIATPIESIPDLDAQVKAERAQKLKRSKW